MVSNQFLIQHLNNRNGIVDNIPIIRRELQHGNQVAPTREKFGSLSTHCLDFESLISDSCLPPIIAFGKTFAAMRMRDPVAQKMEDGTMESSFRRYRPFACNSGVVVKSRSRFELSATCSLAFYGFHQRKEIFPAVCFHRQAANKR